MTKTPGQLNPDLVALLELTHKHLLDIQYGCYVFNPAGLTSSGAQGVTQIVRYDTGDSFATVEAAGYFNSYAATFQTGDTLQVYSTAAVDGGFRAYQVTAATGGTLTIARHDPPRAMVQYFINATDLLAGTPQYVRSPMNGRVAEHNCVVQATIGASGGTLTLAVVGAGAMTGGVITILAGTAAGTAVNGTAITKNAASVITTGGVLSITPSASFDGAGAINGEILIDPTT